MSSEDQVAGQSADYEVIQEEQQQLKGESPYQEGAADESNTVGENNTVSVSQL